MATIEEIERNCGAVAHEANRIYCLSLGDFSQPSWENAPLWQRESMISGVRGVLAGNTPSQSHENWLRQKLQEGWVYGEKKDPLLKQHPCMVSYDQLPHAQKQKDHLFVAVVTAMAEALGLAVNR